MRDDPVRVLAPTAAALLLRVLAIVAIREAGLDPWRAAPLVSAAAVVVLDVATTLAGAPLRAATLAAAARLWGRPSIGSLGARMLVVDAIGWFVARTATALVLAPFVLLAAWMVSRAFIPAALVIGALGAALAVLADLAAQAWWVCARAELVATGRPLRAVVEARVAPGVVGAVAFGAAALPGAPLGGLAALVARLDQPNLPPRTT
jgi:hypothetical protein